jgi:alanyl-tRNA synthetase
MERVAFLKQGVGNMYEIDQVRPVLDRAAELSGKTYGANHEDDVRMRVIADHVRSSLMLMTDGVVPSNDGRGYVLRRLLRRSIRSMRLLGFHDASFGELFEASKNAMAASYPDVAEQFSRVSALAVAEEESFLKTLEAGTTILDVAVADTKKGGESLLAGETAFLLHDTYGFPIDLTLEIAEESGLSVDRENFDKLMHEQRTRAKTDARSKRSQLADVSIYGEFRASGETVFTGYDELVTESTVLGIIVEGQSVASAKQGDTAEIILGATSLYAESGGQVSDKGVLRSSSGIANVVDVQKPVPGLISHTVTISQGVIAVGDRVSSEVDALVRFEGARAHTATHLVHAALRDTLGPHATQAGSLNRAGYMRLDFSWNQALGADAESAIETIVNNAVRDDLEVTTRILPVDEAKAQGAMALFGEKYGATVRMVDVGGPWSRELCAGTHVSRSSQVGVVSLLGESSVSSTARRIEALVGTAAIENFSVEKAILRRLTGLLKTPREDIPGRVEELVTQVKDLERKVVQASQAGLQSRVPALAETVKQGVIRTVVQAVEGVGSADDLRVLAHGVSAALGDAPHAVALGSVLEGRGTVVVVVSPEALARGAHAGELVKVAASTMGGGGGGKPSLAQGGGPDGSAMGAALEGIQQALDSLR